MKTTKRLLCILSLLILGTAGARADTLSITLDKPSQIASPGSTLIFTGTITNLSSGTVFLNADSYTLAGTGFTINDQFFNTVPISLAPGANSGSIELFDVNVPPSPVTTVTESGSYSLFGGSDFNAGNNLGSTSFNLTSPPSAPEIDPSLASSGLVLLFGGVAVLRGRRFRKAI